MRAVIRLIHESSERDLRIAEVKLALAALAAQVLRLAAGAGSVARMGAALDKLYEALDAEVDRQRISLHQHEAHEALNFISAYARTDPLKSEIDDILIPALRLVASRLERNPTQQSASESALLEAVRRHGEARDERRYQHMAAVRGAKRAVLGNAATDLSETMLDAIAWVAASEAPATVGMSGAPRKATLAALVKRRLILVAAGPAGYVLTKRGQRIASRLPRWKR